MRFSSYFYNGFGKLLVFYSSHFQNSKFKSCDLFTKPDYSDASVLLGTGVLFHSAFFCPDLNLLILALLL